MSLFQCCDPHQNRLREDQFQSFLLFKNEVNVVQRIEQADFAAIVARAKGEPYNNSAAVITLTDVLATSLQREAYDKYVETIGDASIGFIFYDDFISAPDGVSVDFEQTKNFHYQKYCLFTFASFLDLLCPGSVHWRGQAELKSDRPLGAALDRFQAAELEDRALLISQIIHIPSQADDLSSIFKPRYRRCAICGSRTELQEHHLGGKEHAPYFTIPLCALHHLPVTIAIKRAGIDMGYTNDETERLRRIVMACSVLQWHSCQELQRHQKNNSHEEQAK